MRELKRRYWVGFALIFVFLWLGSLVTPGAKAQSTPWSSNSPSTAGIVLAPSTATLAPLQDQRTPLPEISNPLTGTLQVTPTITVTITPTIPLTTTPTITPQPTATVTPTVTVTPTAPSDLLLPVVINAGPATPFPPPQTNYFCDSPRVPIPDNDFGGVSVAFDIANELYIQDLNVRLDIQHDNIGDLVASLTHINTGRTVTLIDRNRGSDGRRCTAADIGTILDDEISLPVYSRCSPLSSSPAGIAGIYQPVQSLSAFDGESVQGTWVLNVSDQNAQYDGSIRSWCLAATIGAPPTPTPDPPSLELPDRARVYGVPSYPQSLPLDCESRVAVDWAAFLGRPIGELAFYNNLPDSDDPDAGFVYKHNSGVYGIWGQIPPHPYGVHAEPVAALLRQYGLPAYAHRPLSWDALRAEIAAGYPVFVWIIGGYPNEIPVYYAASDGHISIVAHYEHVALVVGYTPTTVTLLDNGTEKNMSVDTFLSTWSALENMAITTSPDQ